MHILTAIESACCKNCGTELIVLPGLYDSSGNKWFGCEACNTVFQYSHDSFTGEITARNEISFSFKDYIHLPKIAKEAMDQMIRYKEIAEKAGRRIIDSFSGEYRFLSNFWPVDVEFEGTVYPSVEHAYQASKTVDPALRKEIREAPSAGKAKKLGQELTKRPDWNEQMRISNMTLLVEAKFTRGNQELTEKLLATDNAELIEGNTWCDTFFGIYNGIGKNYLGKILMATREKIRNNR